MALHGKVQKSVSVRSFRGFTAGLKGLNASRANKPLRVFSADEGSAQIQRGANKIFDSSLKPCKKYLGHFLSVLSI